MDTMSAFAMGAANRGKPHRVFDWNKAAEIIRDKQPDSAIAGLSGDLEFTADTIFANGKRVTDACTYLSSSWAMPVLILDDGNEIACWVYEDDSDGWDANTYWPQSAIDILDGKVNR